MKEAAFDNMMNTAISKAPHSTGQTADSIRATVMSASTMFTAVAVLLFFIPTIYLPNEGHLVHGWIIPSGVLIASTMLLRRSDTHP